MKFLRTANAEKYCSNCKFMIKENKKSLDLEYKKKNKEKLDQYNKEYRENNREIIRAKDKEYYSNNKEKRIANTRNSPNKNLNKRNYQKRKRKDPKFKLHQSVSFAVNKALKRNGFIKGGSIIKYLPYTIQELKEHLEKLFESWMTWQNWGMYNKNTWNDNDPSTWTWNIDHIIPQINFYYISMEDDEFKKCWALNNLRPYSAKQNIIDQARRK
jgi:hypothetical protein